jgi:hypothetical protein
MCFAPGGRSNQRIAKLISRSDPAERDHLKLTAA